MRFLSRPEGIYRIPTGYIVCEAHIEREAHIENPVKDLYCNAIPYNSDIYNPSSTIYHLTSEKCRFAGDQNNISVDYNVIASKLKHYFNGGFYYEKQVKSL